MSAAPTAQHYLQSILRLFPEGGRPVEQYLVEHGRAFPERAGWPRGVRWGTPKECFRNAFLLAERYRARGWRYCEGIGVNYIPCMHAWVLDSDGQVVDNTWKERAGGPREYFGVALSLDLVRTVMLQTHHWGVIYTLEFHAQRGQFAAAVNEIHREYTRDVLERAR